MWKFEIYRDAAGVEGDLLVAFSGDPKSVSAGGAGLGRGLSLRDVT
jgi:hypothetical protein